MTVSPSSLPSATLLNGRRVAPTTLPKPAVRAPGIELRSWVLAVVAGWVDATGFVALGGLFVANMSGNMVALGAHFGQGQWHLGWSHLVALPVFAFGIFLGSLWMLRPGVRRPKRWIFVMEAALLVAMAVVLSTNLAPARDSLRFWMTAVPAFLAMGLQNATMRRVGALTVHTTFMTGMLSLCAVQAAQTWTWWRLRTRGRGALRRQRAWRVLGRQSCAVQGIQAAGLWLVYTTGALTGSVGLLRVGSISLAVPVVALLGLAVASASPPGGPETNAPARR